MRAAEPDPASRLLVPLLTLALTSVFCCVDAYVLEQEEPTNARAAELVLAPPASAEAPPESEAGRNGAPTTVPAEPEPPLGPPAIRVRIAQAAAGSRVRFEVRGPYRILADPPADAPTRRPELLAQGDALRDATAQSFSQAIAINGVILPHTALTVLPERAGTLWIEERSYPGALRLEARERSALDAINLVDLEDYVAGVLFAEMPARFHPEALRAQAVAARTYALYHAQRGKDLRDDQGSQVYLGLERADAEARRLTQSTRGEVLTWEGVPFETYFHSSCGGVTSGASAVFGMKAPPPLGGGVTCGGCDDSPHARWERRVTGDRLAELYRGAFGDRLTLRSEERDATGRTLRFAVVDPKAAVVDQRSADRLRNELNQGQPLSQQILSTRIERLDSAAGESLLKGRGFGHGVGLCQYGADGLADRGEGYRRILERYYPGARVERLYD